MSSFRLVLLICEHYSTLHRAISKGLIQWSVTQHSSRSSVREVPKIAYFTVKGLPLSGLTSRSSASRRSTVSHGYPSEQEYLVRTSPTYCSIAHIPAVIYVVSPYESIIKMHLHTDPAYESVVSIQTIKHQISLKTCV